jgi:cytosine/adenosine deaminase-related metal-dependent hydrolase
MPVARYAIADLLLPGPQPRAGGLRVAGDRLEQAGEDAGDGRPELTLDGGGALALPGLINAHDHLELNSAPRIKYRERHQHCLQWFEDIERRLDSDPVLLALRRAPLADRLLIGGLKNLLSGATTVAHHNELHAELAPPFPLRVVRELGFCHSLFRGDPQASHRAAGGKPWLIHLAEGTDERARQELDRLVELGLLGPTTILVHGVGLTAQQRRRLVREGGGLVWCPASNVFLLGQTARVAELAAAGKLALGSDSRISGSRDLLQELSAAAATGQLSAGQLLAAVSTWPARMLGLEPGLGQLRPGGAADFLLLPPGSAAPQALLSASRADLLLVVAGGLPRVGDPRFAALFEATGVGYQPARLDGADKLLAGDLARRLARCSLQEPGLELVD